MKKKRKYLDYGKCPGFTIWAEEGHCLEGHCIVYEDADNNEKAYKLSEAILKLCEENNIGIEETLKTIKENLEINGLL